MAEDNRTFEDFYTDDDDDDVSSSETDEETLAIGLIRVIPPTRAIVNVLNNDDDEGDQERVFDPVLAVRHSYLGNNLEEVHGRTVFDELSVQDIPILVQNELVCIPGQTVPLTLFHPPTVAMLKDIISKDRTIGCISVRYGSTEGRYEAVLDKLGTTVEIYEYSKAAQNEPGFNIKAKARQRFQVLEARQVNGIMWGKVKILPERKPSPSLYESRLMSLDKYRLAPASTLDKATSPGALKARQRLHHYRRQYHVPVTAWPSWVHAQYDSVLLARAVTEELHRSMALTSQEGTTAKVNVPEDPAELSYWVIQNLPLEDNHRLTLLGLNSEEQRLRCELAILQGFKELCCSTCNAHVANQRDVFAMSVEGPQGAYVNPGGHVHETLTLHRAEGVRVVSRPSTEYTWFPGYAWSVAECQQCRTHMGWLFWATSKKLKPEKFWGLCRRSLKPNLNWQETDLRLNS